MEAQRQEFYGLRQRVLDGLDTRAVIFDYIELAASEAVEKYLDAGYAAERIAEIASERLKTSVPPERIKGRDLEDVVIALRRIAHEEARHEIEVTIGEYIPSPDAELVDIDTKGLQSWGEERFGVKLSSEEISADQIKELSTKLRESADVLIDQTELDDLGEYLDPDYGLAELSKWVEGLFEMRLSVEEIKACERREDVIDLVVNKVRERYDRREIEYPVDFTMDLTMALMQQVPAAAGKQLVEWANRRYKLGWEETILRTKMPQQLRDELLAASKKFIEEGSLERAIEEAQAVEGWDALVEHLRERYGVEPPLWMKRLQGADRDNAVRARVESILRAELVRLEQFVLLEVLDPLWREHLYSMEKLRETIGFRAFSQQDPRIEFKREGGRLYGEMLEQAHSRAAEYVFRLRVRPQVAPQQGMPGQQRSVAAPGPARQQPAAAGVARQAGGTIGGLGGFGGTIAGPGFGPPPSGKGQ